MGRRDGGAECAASGLMFSVLRGPVGDAARLARCGDASQTGEARALAASASRRAARAQSSVAGQAEVMAIRTRRTGMRISAPIWRSLSLMVPQVAFAKTVLVRPMRLSAQIST